MPRARIFYVLHLAIGLALLLFAPCTWAQEPTAVERLDELLDELNPPRTEDLVDWLGPVQSLAELLEPMPLEFVPLLERPIPIELNESIDRLLRDRDGAGKFDTSPSALGAAGELTTLLAKELGIDHARTVSATTRLQELHAFAALGSEDLEILREAREELKQVASLFRSGRHQEALSALVNQITLEHELLGDSASLGTSLSSVTTLLYRTADYERAEKTARASIQRVCQERGRSDSRVASCISNWASVLTVQRRLQVAETLHAHSLSLRRELYGDQSPEFAHALLQLSGLFRLRNDIANGAAVVDRAIEILETTEAMRDRLGSLLLERGILGWYSGQEERARDDLNRAVEVLIEVHGGDHPELAKAMGTLADIERGLESFERALELAQDSQAMLERLQLQNGPLRAQSQHRLALCLEVLGQLDSAEQAFRSAISSMQAHTSTPPEDLANALICLSDLLTRRGDHLGAEEISARLLEERRRTQGRSRVLAKSLTSLARRRQAAEDYDGAYENFDEALEIYRDQLSPDHELIAQTLGDLANLFYEIGDTEGARELLEEILEDRTPRPSHRRVYADAHHLAGRLALDSQQLELAAEHAQASLGLRQGFLSAPHAALAQALFLQGTIAEAHGELDDAVEAYSAALDQADSLRTRIVGDERDRAVYADQLSLGSVARALSRVYVALDKPIAAFEASELGRERALLDLLSRSGKDLVATARGASTNANPLLQRRVERQASTQRALLFAEQEMRSASLGADDNELALKKLERDVQEALRSHLASENELEASLREVWPSAAPYPAHDLASQLGSSEGLLHFTIQEQGVSLIALRGGEDGGWLGLQLSKGKLQTAQLREELLSLLESVRSGKPIDTGLHRSLSSALLPPALWKHMEGCEQFIVVPDGLLNELPFDCLLTPQGPWLEHGPRLAYNSSAALYLRSSAPTSKAKRGPRRAVVIGNPSFAQTSAVQEQSSERPTQTRSALDNLRLYGQRLTPLPGSEVEAQLVTEALTQAGWSAETLTGPRASLPRLQAAASGAKVLHIATHGVAAQTSRPYESALALAVPDKVSSQNDGFLTLDDLIRHWGNRLQGCDLVTLSACDSQVGVAIGESRVALSWGFFFAGAESVLVSLWKVDDRATTLLMDRFYRNYAGSFESQREVAGRHYPAGQPMSKAVALQEAKSWLSRSTPQENQARLQQLGIGSSQGQDRGQFPRPGAKPTSQATSTSFDFSAKRFGSAFVLYGQPD